MMTKVISIIDTQYTYIILCVFGTSKTVVFQETGFRQPVKINPTNFKIQKISRRLWLRSQELFSALNLNSTFPRIITKYMCIGNSCPSLVLFVSFKKYKIVKTVKNFKKLN